jgi:hypothetical protein
MDLQPEQMQGRGGEPEHVQRSPLFVFKAYYNGYGTKKSIHAH